MDKLIDFQNMLDYCDGQDFSSYTLNYPPMAVWTQIKDQKLIKKLWKTSLRDHPSPGLYIHVPFCKTKCHYCRYFSKIPDSPTDIDVYTSALVAETKMYQNIFKDATFGSIYIGGGTPSFLEEPQLKKILNTIRSAFHFVKNVPFCFEANPYFLDKKKLSLLKNFGVDRLTLGVQTLDGRLTRKINRTQTVETVFKTYRLARNTGIKFINLDLMCGLPTQTKKSFFKDLASILELKPDMIHVSRYSSTPFVEFARQRITPTVKENMDAIEIEKRLRIILPACGYKMLPFDAWALYDSAQNKQLTHSKRDYVSFLGLGPGAVSRASGYFRYVNTPILADYARAASQNKIPLLRGKILSKDDCRRDYILSNIWYGSLSGNSFLRLFKSPVEKYYGDILSDLTGRGILNHQNDSYFISNHLPSESHGLAAQEAFFENKYKRKIKKLMSARRT